jgi:hypothetical protein
VQSASSAPHPEAVDQLKETLATLKRMEEERLRAEADKRKKKHDELVDYKVLQQELVLTSRFKEQVMRLTQVGQARKAELENCARAASLGYQQKKLEEAYMANQSQVLQEYSQEQASLSSKIKKLLAQQDAAPSLDPPSEHNPSGAAPHVEPPHCQLARQPSLGCCSPPAPGLHMMFSPPPAVTSPRTAPFQPIASLQFIQSPAVTSPRAAVVQLAAPFPPAVTNPEDGALPDKMQIDDNVVERRGTDAAAKITSFSLARKDARLLSRQEVRRELDSRHNESDNESDDEPVFPNPWARKMKILMPRK